MTNLNYNELLQAEIDKVQGYVNGKVDSITVTEVQLLKDKAQLVELEDKLDMLLEEQKIFVEFLESKNTKTKIGKSKKPTTNTEDTVQKVLDKSWDNAKNQIEEESKE